ncbi:DUF1048 domain-containing protein [Microbacterium aureliae]
MAAKWYERVTGSLEQKKQFRQYRTRIEALPEPHRAAAKAVERYLMTVGGMTDGAALAQMLSDSADLWERAAVDGAPVRDIVGADPAAFAQEFAAAYSGRQWTDKERDRLNKAIDDVERDGRS